MTRKKNFEKIEYLMGTLGAMMLIVFWLIIATVPDFFFISPTGENSQLRRVELILSTIGWVAISTGVPLALFFYASGMHRARNLLPYLALIWPVSLIISQCTVYVLEGSFYLSYLMQYPIFIYTDIVLPIFVMMIWYDLRPDTSHLSSSVSI